MVKLILANSFSNVVLLFIRLCITFIMSPVIVRALGDYDYGIWAILASLVGYVGLFDLGMPSAIARYVARYHTLRDDKSLRRVYSTSLIFMAFLGLIAFSLFITLALLAPGLLTARAAESQRYMLLLVIIALQLLLTFPGLVLEGMHEGFQRYALKNTTIIVISLSGVLVLLPLLQRGYGLLTLALGNALGQTIKFLVYWILLRMPKYGAFRLRAEDLSWSSLRELITFGYKSLLQGIAVTISDGSASIVVGALLGPVAVTFYAIPANLVTQARNLGWAITQCFMPIFSELHARGDKDQLAEVLLVSSRYVAALVLPILLGTSALGVPFITRWMGSQYATGGQWVLYFLAAANALTFINPFRNRFLTGIGQQGVLAIFSLASSLLTIALSLLLARPLHKEGVALSALLPLFITEPLVLWYTCTCAGITVKEYTRKALTPLIVPTAVFIASLWILSSHFNPRTYASILGIAATSCLIYLSACVPFAIPKEEHRYILHSVLPRLTSLRSHVMCRLRSPLK